MDARKLLQSVPIHLFLKIGVTCLPFYFIPLFLFSELMDKDEVLDVRKIGYSSAVIIKVTFRFSATIVALFLNTKIKR